MRVSFKPATALVAASVSIFLLCGANGGCFPSTQSSGPATSKVIETQNVGYLVGPAGSYPAQVIPRPDQPIAGLWQFNDTNPIGSGTSFGSAAGSPYSLYTGSAGQATVDNLILNATWYVRYNWIGGCLTNAQQQKQLPNYAYYQNETELANDGTAYDIDCASYLNTISDIVSPVFSLSSSLPASIQESGNTGLTTAYGSPELYVYDKTGKVVATAYASSVSSDGTTATFPFPTTSNGPLSAGMYGTAILNKNSDGSTSYAGGGGYFAVGQNDTSYPAAFGLAAADLSTMIRTCTRIAPLPHQPIPPPICSSFDLHSAYPVVSLLNQDQLTWDGNTVNVGSHPTDVVAYGSSSGSSSSGTCSGYGTCTTRVMTGTGYALVVDTGSNQVSLVNLVRPGVDATLQVGSSPVAAAVNAAGTVGYVINNGSGTMSVIDLSNDSVITSVSVGSSPESIALDASGNIWVGGSGYIKEFSPNSYAQEDSLSASGTVTSLAISSGLNRMVTTIAANSGSSSSSPVNYSSADSTVSSISLSSGASFQPLSQSLSTGGYINTSYDSNLIQDGQLGTGTVISANYGNMLAISATPTGFQVTDLANNNVILSGTTTSPVRSIAVDPDYGDVYLSVPDDNAVITVPLPSIPTS